MTLLLRTIHGSHLYGLNHASSDVDFYEVWSDDAFRGKAKQSIVGNNDTVKVSLSEFMRQCHKGVPQSLEALYSPVKDVNEIEYFVKGFKYGHEAVNTFMRTIKSFVLDPRGDKDTKYRRHAVRLALELNQMIEKGEFTPALSEVDKGLVRRAESMSVDEVKTLIDSISVFKIF